MKRKVVMKEWMDQKVKSVFGNEYEMMSMERLLGGAQKHTYLARCTNGFCFIIYQWDESKTFFRYEDTEVFCSSSAALFEKNNKTMIEQGILTPKLYFMDRSRTEQSYEYAFVEYIDGSDLDYLLEKEPERLPLASQSLLHSIESLHRMKSPYAGQIGNLQNESFDVAAFSLTNIYKDSAYLRELDSEYADLYCRAEEKAVRIAEKLSKRAEYTFIHAELGPNHVMVSKDNRAYLIDIEGARYCDVEEETSFLNIRFGNLLPGLQDVVEEDRMTFYYIGHCFGNLRGAVELKQKGYYDMADLNGMIRFFHRQFQTI